MEALRDYRGVLIALGVLIVALMASVVQVPETEQAVVVRFGEPIKKINSFDPSEDFGNTGAGLVLRIPFADRLVRIDKRLLTVDMEPQQILSTDQLRLNVDAYARFRIIDPVKMVRTAGTPERVQEQLEPILNSVLRQELGKRTFQSLLAAERGVAMQRIRQQLDAQAREYGAQIVDVRIKRADLPEQALESTFSRMQAAREQEAARLQNQRAAQRQAEAAKQADRERQQAETQALERLKQQQEQILEQRRLMQSEQQKAAQKAAQEAAQQQAAARAREQQAEQQAEQHRAAQEVAKHQAAEQRRQLQIEQQRAAQEAAKQQAAEQRRQQQIEQQKAAQENARQQAEAQRAAQQQAAQHQAAQEQRRGEREKDKGR